MADNFDGSFKIYVDPNDPSASNMDHDKKPGGEVNNVGLNPMDSFYKDIHNVKEDIKHMEILHSRMDEVNNALAGACTMKNTMDYMSRGKMDSENLLKLVKLISKKFDGLVRTNAAQRNIPGSEPGSENDQTRSSMIAELGEDVRNVMRKFQALRSRIEANHKQIIDNRYYAVTGEKATEEAIDSMLSSEVTEGVVARAIQEHGMGMVLDVMAEIEERRYNVKEIRKVLMSVHQTLMGIIASPVDVNGAKVGPGPPSPVEVNAAPPPPTTITAIFAGKVGIGKLNDYERETRKQAYLALVIALVLSIVIIALYLNHEAQENRELQ